jgi:hypothetical protein
VTARRPGRSRFLRLGAFGAAAAATVALTQVPVSGAFSAVTGNASNSVSSAASFCTAPGSATLNPSGDTWTDEAAPTYNGTNDLQIRILSSSSGDRYVWTRFVLPTIPARCDVVGAELSYYNVQPTSGRNIDVYRGVPSATPWSAATITWSNQPGYTGTAATNALTTSTAHWQRWNVTDHVLAQYVGGNNGFVLRDRVTHSTTGAGQVYYDLQNATYTPTLVVTWG